jgi:hypothetical protein
MDKELRYVEGEPFYYQIGEVSTILPWWRPNYDRICKFLIQEEVIDIFKKYKDVQIIGNCLWDFDVTWDLDLRLIIGDVFVGWNEVEKDLNKLNSLALNEWRILPDIGVTQDYHILPTKTEIIDQINENGHVQIHESAIAKIYYTKKVIGSNLYENDIRKIPEYQCTPLTEGFLVAYYPKFHKKKILDRILSSKKEVLENAISVDRFLKMGEEEFKKFQNY